MNDLLKVYKELVLLFVCFDHLKDPIVFLAVKLPTPLHRQVLDQLCVVSKLNWLDPRVFSLQLRKYCLPGAGTEGVLHHQVDHLVDAEMLVEG